MMAASYKRIGSVALAIDIMKFIGGSNRKMSLQEIIEAMASNRDTITRQLLTLEEGGFVQKAGDKWEIGIYIGVFWMNIKMSREKTIDNAQADLNKIGAH